MSIGNTEQVAESLLRFESDAGWIEGIVEEAALIEAFGPTATHVDAAAAAPEAFGAAVPALHADCPGKATWSVTRPLENAIKQAATTLEDRSQNVASTSITQYTIHFVDFGKGMEHSPDGKAYLVAHGA